jgi:glycosyltransferase involved in cell wall biosynthesis
MRMKILEAVRNGCSFVSTSIGIEGLDFKDGQDCFIEDNPSLFAEKINILNENTKLQKKFYYNSKRVYEEKFSEEVLGNMRLSVYKELHGNG